ncbi:alpha/beta hydrolase [Brucella intermedia]|uniref:alpha/beta hydrolase n=1 Tax=Brucella intermedia TaxID=94625 RepID=UPI0018AC5EAF|nr:MULTISPECIES: alpha/beta fold hydrolase [Brucella/Ochrobactrum group]
MTRHALLGVLATFLILAGCDTPRAVLWHGPNSSPQSVAAAEAAIVKPAKPAAVVPIYVATSRQRSDDFSQPYNSNRSKTLNFAQVDVGIPAAHVKGQVESTGYKPDPAKNFAATAFQPYEDAEQFLAQLNAALAKQGPKDREILIFVHGYNNNFADSTFRTAQFVHDYKMKSVAVEYAWPSGGDLGLYVYDRDSADFARDGLARLLELVARSKAERIVLVGHSMGGFVTMEALRTLSLRGEKHVLRRITALLLAAPDIDLDVFEKQIRDIDPMPRPTAVMTSRSDRALGVSSFITGGHARVGDGTSIPILQKYGIAVIDATDLDGGAHNVFASSPSLMALVSDGTLSLNALNGRENRTTGQAVLADGASAIKGAASLVLYLPGRLVGAAGSAGP